MRKIYMQYFEWYLPSDQLLWKRVAIQAKALSNLGITTLWLPPAYKGAYGANDTGYAVYDLYDLGEFDQKGSIPTKYGSKEEYLKAIEALHEQGIEVLADAVLNHRLGADECELVSAIPSNWNQREVALDKPRMIQAWTRFTFKNRHGLYSDFTWNHHHFDGTDWDELTHEKALFLFSDKHWDDEVDDENGNYDYLMGADLDMSNPDVVNECIQWGKWYLQTTNVDGFRFDAVKHIRADFFPEWVKAVQTVSKKPLQFIGEYWNSDLNSLLNFIDESEACMSLFDIGLHYHLYDASSSNGQYDMRTLFKGTLVEVKPELAITFVDNHDTQPGQALQSWVLDWFKAAAYAIILLYPKGTPCIFYGDMYGIPHDEKPIVEELSTIMFVRKYFAYGEFHEYLDHPDCIGWTQSGDTEHEHSGYALILTNHTGGEKRLYMGKQFAHQNFFDCLFHIDTPVIIDEHGYGLFQVEDGSVSLYVLQAAYELLSIYVA